MRENANDMLRLTMTATTSWPVYSGAEQDLIERAKAERSDDLEERVGNAIEMAIISKAKRFIKSSSCQKVIDGIWSYVSTLWSSPSVSNCWFLVVNVSTKRKAVTQSFRMYAPYIRV